MSNPRSEPATPVVRAEETKAVNAAPGSLGLDCSYPEDHAHQHHPHLATERVVCDICHPPAYLLDAVRTQLQPPKEARH